MITHNLIIYSIITIWILTVHYVNCAGILWGDHSTDTTKTYIRTTTKASRPVTEKQGPFVINDENTKLICTQRGGIIQCYSVNKGKLDDLFNRVVMIMITNC
ncbi:unnamed protein product [Schistosoma margrebowiei]|uniref:Uncharacterized protein n=1 Tax=Schistosoma margrebowiei TaxID=48269 RepID=A0AA85AIS7_9TREM|nr:unnamed protein product [Schistosoma margrebowiei]